MLGYGTFRNKPIFDIGALLISDYSKKKRKWKQEDPL